MFRSFTALIPAAVLVAAAFAPVAHAEDRFAEQTHVAVKADDFATADHVTMLYRRIEAAAKRVCDSDSDEATVMTQAADKACENEAISDTIQSINAPQLSRLDPARAPGARPVETAANQGLYASR